MLGAFYPQAVLAQGVPSYTVKLTVLKISDAGDDADSLSDADFYVAGAFTPTNGTAIPFNNEGSRIEGEEIIHPNWVFEFQVPSSSGGGRLDFRALDYDSGLNFGDDETVKATLDVDFGSCAITGPGVSTTCGWDIALDQSDAAVIKIEVFWPPSSPGLLVRCLQNPLLPTPGQPVTVEMVVLDGTGTPKVASELDILINNTRIHHVTAVSQTSFTFTASGTNFTLQCRARNTIDANPDAELADTWARNVRVGFPSERWSPIGVTGPSARAIDVVLLADRDFDPTGGLTGLPLPQDPNVLTDMRGALWGGFFNNPYILANQHRFNFWLGQSTADIDGNPTTCFGDALVPPEDWDQYAFADVGWIVHLEIPVQRDCARPDLRLFGAVSSNPSTAVHETGHLPFGLADEYCCDGGYTQAAIFPNVYDGLVACTSDLPTDGTPATCRMISGNWFTSDPIPDLMEAEQITFNRLDRRRADWLIAGCVTEEGC